MNGLFENTKIAFASRSDAELKKSLLLLKLISSSFLNKAGTAVIKFLLMLRLPINFLMRRTMFDHFCGGTTLEESQAVVQKLNADNIDSCLNYSIEGINSEAGFDRTLEEILRTIEASSPELGSSFAVFKPTGYGSTKLFEKVSRKEPLTSDEVEAWKRVKQRFHLSCEKAVERNLKLLIDAEESWIQPALDDLLEEMMATYNQDQVVVYATVQLYLKERLPYLKKLIESSRKAGYQIGIKLVRGAYLEKETNRSLEHNAPNPLCPSKEATDINFDKGLELILGHLDHAAVFIGSHNEASTLKALKQMKNTGIPENHPRVCFAHLFKMSDNISYNLSNKGYNVVKYLPFGPVNKVIPYLIRRAEENTSVANQTTREIELIKTELKRRKQA
jgi:proline dehydrogenase